MSHLKDLAKQLNTFITGLRDKRGALVRERDTLETERESLLSATLSRADTKALLLGYIDQQAATWNDAARWREVFDELTYPDRYPGRHATTRPDVGRVEPMNLRDFDAILCGDKGARATVIGDGFPLIAAKADFRRLCDGALFALFGDQLKAKLSDLFDRFYSGPIPMDAKRIGPPVAERRQRLEVIGKRLAEIAGELTKIDSEARELSADLSEPTPAPARPQAKPVTPAANRGERRYSAADVQTLTGLSFRELRELADLRPLPPSAGFGEGWYCAAETEHWLRSNGYHLSAGSWVRDK